MKIEMEPKDYDEIRDETQGLLEESEPPTNQVIDAALGRSFALIGQAAEWGWGDTEVREQICDRIDKVMAGKDPDE